MDYSRESRTTYIFTKTIGIAVNKLETVFTEYLARLSSANIWVPNRKKYLRAFIYFVR